MTGQTPNPAHPENAAKQAWDDEGGSLHPDETKTETADLAEPVDQAATTPPAGDVRTVYANERAEGEATPEKKPS